MERSSKWALAILVLMGLMQCTISTEAKSKASDPAVIVAGRDGNASSGGFGTVYVIDDPLTVAISNASKLLGRAKGMVAVASQDATIATYYLNISFQNGTYNGTIAIQGTDTGTSGGGTGTMAVVGGTEDFSLSLGLASITVVKFDLLGETTVFYNVTLHRLFM